MRPTTKDHFYSHRMLPSWKAFLLYIQPLAAKRFSSRGKRDPQKRLNKAMPMYTINTRYPPANECSTDQAKRDVAPTGPMALMRLMRVCEKPFAEASALGLGVVASKNMKTEPNDKIAQSECVLNGQGLTY